jgi:aminoglycoside phosphotransferase (APT) family kinase protein
MSAGKMHVDEVDTSVSLVNRLLATQFPQWAALPIKPVPSDGTDNAIYRLGSDMAVRLPRIHWATTQIHKEHKWLPKLAPFLPLAIPVPLAKGQPGEGYPYHWSIYQWLEGEDADLKRMADPRQAALDLAHFILALQQLDTNNAPSDSSRGEPLARRDTETRHAIATLRDAFDANAMTAVWDAAIKAPVWHRPPVWIHGDLKPGNLLSAQGRLSAVIDFGGLGVGDPACDVMAAWLFLSAETRPIFRATLQIDEATWARGRGWALTVAVIAFPYYEMTNPGFAEIARRTIHEVLTDYRVFG